MPDFARMIDELQYSLIVLIASLHWSLQKALLMSGYTIKLLNQWLIEHAFAPIIAQTNQSLGIAVSIVFVVALLLLGITYLLAAFIRLDVVSPRNAMMWYLAGMLFFSIGPSFYQGMNDFRLNISQMMYVSVLQGLQGNAGDFSSLAQVNSNDLDLGILCDQFDVYLPGATGAGPLDGLDIAMAYLRVHAQDVMGYPQPVYSPGCTMYMQNPNSSTWAGVGGTSVVPMDWNMEGHYFDHTTAPSTWEGVEDSDRDHAVSMAGASQQRALTAWPLLLFALVEQIVALLITIAMGITFISFGVAILFAFFKRTESIAHSLINQWIELIVQTVIISLIQALVIGFFLAGAATGSAAAIVGMGLVCLVFIVITMWSGVKAVWNSFNRLFNAMGQASGGVLLTPGSITSAAVTGTAAAATGGVALMTSVGSNALAGMTALQNGATPAQAAGLAFGDFHTLSGAAQTLTRLPGLRGTALGEAAEQFTEGALTRQVARDVPVIGRAAGPLLGSMLLSDRDPENTDYDKYGRPVSRAMLVPAVGEALERWTLPQNSKKRSSDTADEQSDTEESHEGVRPSTARRTGLFTPLTPVTLTENQSQTEQAAARRQERSDYAAEMNSEEMEQHVSDALKSSTGASSTLGSMMDRNGGSDLSRFDQLAARLEGSAEALAQAARLQMQVMLGQLNVAGSGNVAGVMGDVIRGVQAERQQTGQPRHEGLDHLTTADRMARTMGVMPAGDTPIQENLARFGLFADQAVRLGLSGQQTEDLIREVKTSPEGQLSETTRTALVEHVRSEGNLSYENARDDVSHLEHSARMLPNEITAIGLMALPQVALTPEITVAPQVSVTVAASDSNQDATDTQAIEQASVLDGSANMMGGKA